ncbi:hypothetical protein GCM10008018_08120 [Paenibacillus marchantiophytorum]|uniref:Uncharacterized protein n=1 Tax=Paenibacillus marchantiophytorum TaxID=1619310 RepID=A0ABQ2BTI2_9BACL|nr:hypothetical protein [Paenibacillus marchantiophytorum]GGI44641.1 hypothetical protein GCM10008018_08120 [Paenibacillus marchantiophytorum]
MKKIKQANIVRYTERNDVRCVDIEVKADGVHGVLLAEFAATLDHDFDLRHVYRKDASSEIDWYDNNLHEAFQDVSDELFHSKWVEREEFKDAILAIGTIRTDLEEHFKLSRTASLFHTDDVEDQTFLH